MTLTQKTLTLAAAVALTSTVALASPRQQAKQQHLDPESIQRVVRAHDAEYRACYDDGLKRDSSLAGRVRVQFVIQSDGTVSSATDTAGTMPDAALVSCVLSAFRGLKFSSFQGDAMTVVYPLVFDRP